MILYGHALIARDAQGRWRLPRRFAAALEEGGIVTVGLDGCLWLYPLSAWQAFVERTWPQLALTDAAGREFARRIFAHALALNKTRLRLPSSLLEQAGIGESMVIVGLVDHFELWSPARWEEESEKWKVR